MKIVAGWIKKREKDGAPYLSCEIELPFLGKANFIMVKNDKKENPSAPDYEIVWYSRKESRAGASQNLSDDIPF